MSMSTAMGVSLLLASSMAPPLPLPNTVAMEVVDSPTSDAMCYIRWYREDFMNITCFKDGELVNSPGYYYEKVHQFYKRNGVVRMIEAEDLIYE